MFTIGVQCEFSAAHFHGGAGESCRRIHGHNYRVEARVGSARLRGNMVVDFTEVRQALARATAPWDHQVLNEVDDFDGREPTAENISRLLFAKMAGQFGKPLRLLRITVWETGDCWASYGEGEEDKE
ncbi:MAG: 6-carboxytetrahydropterin synthase [PVC group bacterium]